MSEGNGFITREAILQPKPRRFAEREIPGWGKFRIRSVTELERSTLEVSCKDREGNLSAHRTLDLKCKMIVLAAVDANDNQLLIDGDIGKLRQQDASLTGQLADFITEHWRLGADLEDLKKNCEPTPSGVSQ